MIEDESDKSKKQTFLRDSKTLPDSIDQHQMMRHHRPKREKDVDHQKPPSTRMNDWYGGSLFNAVDIIRKYALKEIKYTIRRLTGRKIACPSVELKVNGKQLKHIVDTGTTLNIISSRAYKSIENRPNPWGNIFNNSKP